MLAWLPGWIVMDLIATTGRKNLSWSCKLRDVHEPLVVGLKVVHFKSATSPHKVYIWTNWYRHVFFTPFIKKCKNHHLKVGPSACPFPHFHRLQIKSDLGVAVHNSIFPPEVVCKREKLVDLVSGKLKSALTPYIFEDKCFNANRDH